MRCSSPGHEQVPNFMVPEPAREEIELFRGIHYGTSRVQDTACQEPSQSLERERPHERHNSDHAKPAHDHVYHDNKRARETLNGYIHEGDSRCSDDPDRDQQPGSHCTVQYDQARRRVCSRNQQKYGRMIDPPENGFAAG